MPNYSVVVQATKTNVLPEVCNYLPGQNHDLFGFNVPRYNPHHRSAYYHSGTRKIFDPPTIIFAVQKLILPHEFVCEVNADELINIFGMELPTGLAYMICAEEGLAGLIPYVKWTYKGSLASNHSMTAAA